jgi:hypothetical protein
MSDESEMSLGFFIKASELQLWVRSYADWYGSIVLIGLDTLRFELLIFHTKNLERTFGTTCRFEWDSEEKNLVFKSNTQSKRPVLNDDHLQVPVDYAQEFWFDKKQFSKVPEPLIEAFLDNMSRPKILRALADKDQRIGVLRWLVENDFTVYRHLRTPTDNQGAYEKIVFSPKLDFLADS